MAIWIPNRSSSTHCNSAFAISNETFSVFQTPSVSSSKVMEDMEEESLKRKESISGNHILMW